MTEETTNQSLAPEPEFPVWQPLDVLTSEAVPSQSLSGLLDHLLANREQLESALLSYRRMYQNAQELREDERRFRERAYKEAREFEQLLQLTREAQEASLGAVESVEKFTWENSEVKALLRLAIRAGVLGGRPTEAHRLCVELDSRFPGAEEMWREVSATLREEDSMFPIGVPFREAVLTAWRHERYALRVSPSDPRLSDAWQVLNDTAKREAGFCDDWDSLVAILGGIAPEPLTYSGDVTVTGTFRVTVPVSGVSLDDGVDVDVYDIRDNIDWSYDVEIDYVDADDLEAD